MNSNIFAIYKGKEYLAGIRVDGSIVLRSSDEGDIKYGFIKHDGINKNVKCFKYVLKSEVEEIYRKNIKAEYNGYEFMVLDETKDMLLICVMGGEYNTWIQLDMDCVDKGVYQKWVDKKDTLVKIEKEVL